MDTQILDLKIYTNKLLGNGSYAKVFVGEYKNNTVAVKIISTKNLDDKIITQLKREMEVIKIIQQNKHTNIASYYNLLQKPNHIIIIMELCAGGELTKYIRSGIDLNTLCNYFLQILNGYNHLLSHEIMHRDIKSQNILLCDQTIKIIDFGLSKIFDIDINNTICGSPLYMAPELLNNNTYDSKTDIWSIGILLYEMVYGYTPFHDCKHMTILKELVEENNIWYPKYSNNNIYIVPSEIILFIKKMLEPNPIKRLLFADVLNMWKYICKQYEKKVVHNEITLSDITLPKTMPIQIQNIKKKSKLVHQQWSPIIQNITVGSIKNINIDINNLSLIENSHISQNELINIDDIDMSIKNTSKYSTGFEYIKKQSHIMSPYIYSKSAPTILSNIGRLTHNAVTTLKHKKMLKF